MSVNIRTATIEDVARIVEMGLLFHASSPYAAFSAVTREALTETATGLIAGGNSTVIVSEDAAWNITGMIGLALYRHPMSGKWMAAELCWWVDPQHRGSTGLRLLAAAERWAVGHKAAGISVAAPEEFVESIYRATGFTKVEVQYQKMFGGG